ncbi:periplasmic heavy metal sensor [Agrobacterium sp. B1(2019)]|uniref:periplasmic heavy metal sensor n=1 Tax=Agrobacterium sp. B1(2019) TaxID=2607032 RepID=UPI0011F06746|nr:periplasmic heavy metal sensor [Agrobacterium sp. B1(2019)]TZG34131.1 periplasmic heavy metal sensor [Agrobacterium sp. B1(2019)]
MTDQNFRWIVAVLLVVNTFFVCALAGAGFVYLSKDTSASASRMPLAGEQLPQAERQAFRRVLSDARKPMRETSAEARQARIEAASLMGADTLDTNALSDALERARKAEYAVRAAVELQAVEFARTLSLDARRRLAEGLLSREAPKPATK